MAAAAKRSGGAGLTLSRGARPRIRKPRRHEWTKAREAAFLGTLADTCNVTLAAQAAGLSTTSAYQRRKANAAFRAGWAEAIASAYQQLEMVLLERALNGTEKVVRRRDGSEEVMRDYSNSVALTLLKMHRGPFRRRDDRCRMPPDACPNPLRSAPTRTNRRVLKSL